VIRPPYCAADEKTPVAAAQIDNHRGLSPEKSLPIERPFRPMLERGPRPLCGIQNLTCNRHAKLSLDFPTVFHEIRQWTVVSGQSSVVIANGPRTTGP